MLFTKIRENNLLSGGCFKDTDIAYEFDNKYILLLKKNKTNKPAVITQQSSKNITGIVIDPNGEAVIGANVSIKGTTIGTITDMDGKFSLDIPNNATLLISYIGYIPQEIRIGNQNTVKINLKKIPKLSTKL